MKYYDRAGNETDRYGFRKDFDWNNRFDLKTEVEGHLVSTVDLGTDYNFNMTGEPLYYETMIFPEDSLEEIYCRRYSSEKEARKGHKEAVKALKEMIEEGE